MGFLTKQQTVKKEEPTGKVQTLRELSLNRSALPKKLEGLRGQIVREGQGDLTNAFEEVIIKAMQENNCIGLEHMTPAFEKALKRVAVALDTETEKQEKEVQQ